MELLGYKSVDELNSEMYYTEYVKWMAYLNLKFKRREKIEYYLANISCVLANIWGKKKHKIEDFLLEFDEKDKGKSRGSGLINKLKMWAAMINRHFVGKREKENGDSNRNINSVPDRQRHRS